MDEITKSTIRDLSIKLLSIIGPPASTTPMTKNNNQQFTYDEALQMYHGYMDLAVRSRSTRLGEHWGNQLRKFCLFMEEKTSWLKAPASTKYHLSIDGGLLIHSVGVCQTAIKLTNLLMPEIPTDSVIICSMFHDAGKVYHASKSDGSLEPRYLPNILQRASGDRKAGEQSAAQPFRYNDEVKGPEISLTIKDAMLPLRFMALHDYEIQALLLADGQYVDENKSMQHKEHPLGLIVHYADYWNGHVLEGGWQASDLSGILGL